MGPIDKADRALWNLVEGTKAATTKNIAAAVHDGKIKVDAASMPVLLALINASIDEGYHKGTSVFNRELSAALAADSAPQRSFVPNTEQAKKKRG